jgi:hypothetical protein
MTQKQNEIKIFASVQVLKILDNIGTEFLNQKEPLMFMVESEHESEENKTFAMDRIEQLEVLYRETERASRLVKNNLFDLVD